MGKVVREITFDIHVGKRVKIIDGAFSGFEGPITEVNGDKVKVTVDMFGRETPVELDSHYHYYLLIFAPLLYLV